ncbi:MAG: asparaginase [Actinomycetota bacterium]|nr:asparaginase [Actinomycetota bacterium]
MTAAPPVLLEVSRNGLLESRHRGSLVLLDASGNIEVAVGAPLAPTFPRSSLKPLQAVTMATAGFGGGVGHGAGGGASASIALAAASHDGEDVHLAGVRAILAQAGLQESALQCPEALPAGPAMLSYVAGGGVAARICHNCSGKHAAMLATCALNGWSTHDYLARPHPLQAAIRATIELYCAEPITTSGVDGCGAPAHAVSLVGLASAFAKLVTAADGTAAADVRRAMQTWPRLIGGTGRPVTELTAAVDGLLCKDGAEGVWAAAMPGGRAFAVKVEDGSNRALPPLLAAALAYWGVDNELVGRWSSTEVRGGDRTVGAIGWSPELVSLLGL